MGQYLCIVRRNDPLLHGYLMVAVPQKLPGQDVEIIVDRRRSPSGEPPEASAVADRPERRHRTAAERALREQGYAIIPVGDTLAWVPESDEPAKPRVGWPWRGLVAVGLGIAIVSGAGLWRSGGLAMPAVSISGLVESLQRAVVTALDGDDGPPRQPRPGNPREVRRTETPAGSETGVLPSQPDGQAASQVVSPAEEKAPSSDEVIRPQTAETGRRSQEQTVPPLTEQTPPTSTGQAEPATPAQTVPPPAVGPKDEVASVPPKPTARAQERPPPAPEARETPLALPRRPRPSLPDSLPALPTDSKPWAEPSAGGVEPRLPVYTTRARSAAGFPGVPRVDLECDRSSAGLGLACRARLRDDQGQPVLASEVLLMARTADGGSRTARLGTTSDPGTYAGELLDDEREATDLRLRVVLEGRRIEIPITR
jgi:hypothetical protein